MFKRFFNRLKRSTNKNSHFPPGVFMAAASSFFIAIFVAPAAIGGTYEPVTLLLALIPAFFLSLGLLGARDKLTLDFLDIRRSVQYTSWLKSEEGEEISSILDDIQRADPIKPKESNRHVEDAIKLAQWAKEVGSQRLELRNYMETISKYAETHQEQSEVDLVQAKIDEANQNIGEAIKELKEIYRFVRDTKISSIEFPAFPDITKISEQELAMAKKEREYLRQSFIAVDSPQILNPLKS